MVLNHKCQSYMYDNPYTHAHLCRTYNRITIPFSKQWINLKALTFLAYRKLACINWIWEICNSPNIIPALESILMINYHQWNESFSPDGVSWSGEIWSSRFLLLLLVIVDILEECLHLYGGWRGWDGRQWGEVWPGLGVAAGVTQTGAPPLLCPVVLPCGAESSASTAANVCTFATYADSRKSGLRACR